MVPPPSDKSSAACPFCRRSVSPDLLVFGGACPHCLIDIPGEEAPTDPGEELRKKIEEAERKPVWPKMVAVTLMLLILTCATGFTIVWTWFQDSMPEAVVKRFKAPSLEDHEDQEIPADLIARPEDTGGVADAMGGREPASRPIIRTAPAEPEASVVVVSDGGSLDDFSVSALPASRGPTARVLEDQTEIETMIDRIFHLKEHELQSCYEARLSSRPSLKGTWDVGFVVGTERRATEAWATPLATSDSTLERCIVRCVRGWDFAPISEPTTYTYRAEFGS